MFQPSSLCFTASMQQCPWPLPMTNSILILKKISFLSMGRGGRTFTTFKWMFEASFWFTWLMCTANSATRVVMFLQASLKQSSAINSMAHVSSAEQGHSSPSRGTFLEIIKLTESSFLHALYHLGLSAAMNIVEHINSSKFKPQPASQIFENLMLACLLACF